MICLLVRYSLKKRERLKRLLELLEARNIQMEKGFFTVRVYKAALSGFALKMGRKNNDSLDLFGNGVERFSDGTLVRRFESFD